MANAASTIEIELEIRQAINRLGKLEGELKKSSSAMDRVAKSTNKMESAFKSARNAASALFAAISVQQIAQAADTFTRFANQIRIATTSAAEAAAVQKELYQVSQATGTAIEDTTKLYSRLRIAADQLGSSQAETIRITEIVAKSLAAAGTSSTEASGALLQLAQALNSPKVQAEEFNSLIDGMPNLLKEVEKQLGLTAGSLKKFVTDGNLTNQLFKDAILGSAEAINEQFGAAQDTIATSFTRLNNAFILLVGNFEKSTGFFNSIASVISTLAENMDELARVLKAVAVGFAIAFAPKVIRAIRDTAAAMTVLGAATKTNVIGALAALGFYIADVTGGLDSLMEKLGLTKDKADETAGAIVDLTKSGGSASKQTELITDLEASFKGLSIYATTQIMAISEAFEDSNLTIEEYTKKVEAFVKSYTEFYDKVDSGELPGFPSLQFDPDTQEQLFLSAEQARKEFELIFKFIAQGFKAFENLNGEAEKYLTYLERITNYLSEQLRLLELSEENANRTAGAIVSGVSGAGPNASRAMSIAQSKSPEEAAAKLILSNEKVAAAIDKSFEILFDILDPVIDLLGDLISAINRLIGALIQNATNAAEGLLDTVGLGPNGYIFGGGLARDLEDAFGFGPGSSRNRGPSSMQLAFAEADKVFLAIEQEQSTLEKLQPKIDELAALLDSLSLSDIIERFTEQTQEAIQPLQAEIEKYEFALTQTGPGGGANYFADFYNQQIQTATDKIAEVNEKTSIVISGLISEFLSEPLATLDDLERSATDSIAAIKFQNLSAEEQIKFRYDEAIATIEQQQALADLINDEELRSQLLDSVNRATQAQNDLLAKQQEELQKLNEEREREAALLLQQQGQSEAEKIINNLQKTFTSIIDLVEDLKDQAIGLLFSDKSLLPASVRFESATTRYQELLAAALDPDATEENVKDFQAFVDTYLKSAQDVFKSSSQYQNIFDSVLADIEEVADFVSIAMPISEIESVKKQLVEVAEEFGIGIEEVIAGLDNLSRSLVYQAVISNVPVSAFVDSEQSDLVIEAVVTAIADPVNSDTQIEAVVTAIMGAGSNTVIDAIVKAVQAPGSDTTINAIVSAVMAAGSDTQIEAIVKAVQAPGSTTTISTIVQAILDAKNSDTIVETPVTAVIDQANSSLVVDAVVTAVSGQELEIDAIVTAVQATGSDTVIEAVVTAVEDKNLSDTEIEAIVTAAMATGSSTTILAVVNAILDAAKSDLTIEALVSAIAASGSDTQIEALVTAIAKSGSDTQIEALVTAIMASGSDTQIEAIVKAIMASGSDTQIEAIVSAVASNTPVISAIVAAVAANTPVVTPTVTLDDSEITSAFSSLSQTLENSINRLIESIRLQELKSQAAASGIFTTGGYASTYATNMAGGGTTNLISGSLITDLRPSGDTTQYQSGLQPGFQLTGYLSTDQIFQALLNKARELNPEILSKPYYVLRATNTQYASRTPYLDAFDDLNAAKTFYDNALGNGYYYYKWNYGPVRKYGFNQGGLVPSAMDTIPAMLSPGEYILSPETVRRYGVSNLNRLNSGDTAALNATSDPEVKRLLSELIVAVRENDTEVNVFTDMKGQTKASIEEFRSELRERTRRQGDQYVPARYI